ncbi:hypothetical protein EYF80_016979 [Liparis tanakae]|uniref:Uncharacterized protein n=1 Tax=Liparis tanakae TaxID=230148 RepID=A0A4Z2I4H9_9TELE|nr:hypothetical protein EYF80_016979 [Liparis tanakae]
MGEGTGGGRIHRSCQPPDGTRMRLASSCSSSGLSCGGEDGETAGEDSDVEEEVAVVVVCSDVGVATWLDI